MTQKAKRTLLFNKKNIAIDLDVCFYFKNQMLHKKDKNQPLTIAE
jgi:hypothetical protein